jgi:hypothetical protein
MSAQSPDLSSASGWREPQVSGAEYGKLQDSNGSGPAAWPPASTGGYAGHTGRPTADGAPLRPVGGLWDACRPVPVCYTELLCGCLLSQGLASALLGAADTLRPDALIEQSYGPC